MLPYLIGDDGSPRPWKATTLRQLGKDEAFLEKLVADDPRLLGLDPYDTGISGRVVPFRQVQLSTPTGRTAIPDLVLLSEGGHIVVVEVKLADNPDLRGRSVVAQVVEYAASIASLDDDEAFEWLGDDADESWTGLVRRSFPEAASPERLAATLRRRMRAAEIHLVIVCDGAPEGLRELVQSVAGQAALGAFRLHVVELVPHVADHVAGVLLVPVTVARTEIVARTAVTITYATGAAQPAVSVVASSVEEVERTMEEVRAGRTMRAEFASVITAYDATAPDDLQTIGRSANYKQIRPPSWPRGIHYEFLDRSGGQANVGVELHLESRSLSDLGQGLAALPNVLRPSFPTVSYDPGWKGLGRVFVRVPIDDPAAAARAMTSFIELSRGHIDRLLPNHPG